MLKTVKEYNIDNPNWMIAAWTYNKKNKTLYHTTGSGRMNIALRNDFFSANLYTPDYFDGEKPFYSITLSNGRLNACLFEPDVIDRHSRQDRLSHIRDYFVEIFGIENVLDASDRLTREYTIRNLKHFLLLDIKYLDEEIAEFNRRIEEKNNPGNNDATSKETLRQLAQEKTADKQSKEKQLKKLDEYEKINLE